MKTCCISCATGGTCEGVAKSHKDQIPGGEADARDPDDFDADILADGVAHEMEHTSDKKIATEIAMDHLTGEGMDYYKKLDKMEATKSIRWRMRKNYKVVRKVKFQGLDISIEHDKGMLRHWKDDATGEEGSTKMPYPYGYICRTDGADGEQVDVYVGPEPTSEKIFVVHQMKKPNFKRYDEDKVMVGFESAREAKAAYLMAYDNPKFFGSMTSTDVTAFKRMFVKKSWDEVWAPQGIMPESPLEVGEARSMTKGELEKFAADWRALNKSCGLVEGEDLRKGIFDQMGKLWGKLKEKFGSKEDEARPLKKWVRGGTDKCKTGVCDRLDGTEIDIDDTFTAMKGMQVDGPPAHGNCKCTLEFRMSKALSSSYIPEEHDMVPPAPEGPPMVAPPVMPGMMPGMPMMPPLDPHDMETFEGVQRMLGTIGGVKDPELMQIASKIWGDGYTFEGLPPEVARAEITGFLLDQRDLLGVEPAMPSFAPSPSLPVQDPNGSSGYSELLASAQSDSPSPEVGSPVEESPPPSLMDWFDQDFSQNPDEQEESAPIN